MVPLRFLLHTFIDNGHGDVVSASQSLLFERLFRILELPAFIIETENPAFGDLGLILIIFLGEGFLVKQAFQV